jgi:hypothetical protein
LVRPSSGSVREKAGPQVSLIHWMGLANPCETVIWFAFVLKPSSYRYHVRKIIPSFKVTLCYAPINPCCANSPPSHLPYGYCATLVSTYSTSFQVSSSFPATPASTPVPKIATAGSQKPCPSNRSLKSRRRCRRSRPINLVEQREARRRRALRDQQNR